MNPSGRPDYGGFRRRRASEDVAGNAAVLEIWFNDPANLSTGTLTSPVVTIGNDGGTTQGLTVRRDGLTVTAGGVTITAGGLTVTAGTIEVNDDVLFTLGADNDIVLVNRSTILNANTALTGTLIGTPVTPAIAENSLILANATASGDILVAVNEGGNSQAYLWIDTSAAEMRLYGSGTLDAILTAGTVNIEDDVLLGLGTGSTARLSYDTTDANSNQLLLQLPAAGSVDSPVLIIGQSIESVDFGASATGADYSAVVDPRIALFSSGAVTTGPVVEFRKARGTTAAPTVVTSGDDIGTLDFYGAVANGEYVRAASIRADMTGTIATGRGPGTLTFMTATDAASSVLTTAITISAAQLVTVAAGLTVTTGNVTISSGSLALTLASDITIPATTAAALEISDGTTKFYAVDTRVAVTGVTTHAFDISDYTFASASGAVATGVSVAAHTLNLTGNTQVTTQVDTVVLGARTIAADGVGGACTVDEASTLLLVAPTEGTNVTLTAASALRILDAAGTPTNQYGIYIEAQSGGTTQNYGIYSAGGRNELVNSFTGDNRGLKVSGTVTNAALTDGYGFHEVDVTLAGTNTAHSAASSSWVNITTGTAAAGVYVCARNDGIYEATAATITNALLIFGARMHYLADDTDGLRFPFSLNTNNAAITALFDCQNISDFGTVANAGATAATLLPILRTPAGTLKYVLLYDLA